MAASDAVGIPVSVRVEGADTTLLESTVESASHSVNGGDDSGSHPCGGPIGEAPGPTVTGALDDALRAAGKTWVGQWSNSNGDFLITTIAGESATPSGPWTILLNGVPTPVGGCSMKVEAGDRVLFARDVVFQTMTLGLSGPSEVEPGEKFRLLVEDERDHGAPVAGAVVRSEGLTATTESDGSAGFTVDEPGRYRFKATHPEGIRSNSVEACVGVSGCAGSGTPGARLTGIRGGSRFLRGATPRTLRGSVRASESVRLAVRFRGYRGRCKAWNAARGRLVHRRCGAKPHWITVPAQNGGWSFRTGNLPPGRYRILVRVPGETPPRWRDGENRVAFTVRAVRLGQVPLRRAAARFLARQVRSVQVRRSGLLSAWSAIALGARGNRNAGRLLTPLTKGRFRQWRTADLAGNLAAAIRIRKGRPPARRAAPRLQAMRHNLIARQGPEGSWDGDLNLTAMSVLALPSAPAAVKAAEWLAEQQASSGGFGAAPALPVDVDTTGLVGWALAQARLGPELQAAAAFVAGTQNSDGGFPAVPGGVSNAQSTGLGLLVLRLAGDLRRGPANADGITPAHYLAGISRRSGSIDYMPGIRSSPVWVTAQALTGLLPTGRLIARR